MKEPNNAQNNRELSRGEQPSENRGERLRGELERVRFASENGEFAVCDLALGSGRVVTIVGNILSARPGETVEVWGKWQQDRRFGRQFAIESIRALPPSTREGVERYLASGLIEGIGPVLAERIVGHFGEETLEILDADAGRIREVEGIGAVRAKKIKNAWREQRHARQVMVFLQSRGVSPAFSARIWKAYAEQTVEVVSENPYRLAEDIRGIGFLTADAIAQKSGLERDSLQRLEAGAMHCLQAAHAEGHIYLPVRELIARAADLLQVPGDMLSAALQSLAQQEKIVLEPVDLSKFGDSRGLSGALFDAQMSENLPKENTRRNTPDGADPDNDALCYRKRAWHAEVGAASRLASLVKGGRRLELGARNGAGQHAGPDQNISQTGPASGLFADGIVLEDAQLRAVQAVFEHPVVVITGGPGTGKTTIIRAVVARAQRDGLKILLAAPTGRAAKRMSEATGREARTIHRLLEFSPAEGGFSFDEHTPLGGDLVVIDEASMLDTYLFYALVRAIKPGATLLLVGDIDQLPSVGPGNILGDIIDSGVVKVMRLERVFRQAQQSHIIANAHRINQGLMPISPPRHEDELTDFYTIAADTPLQAQQTILELVSERIERAFGFDPRDDVQILSPMYRGEVGCEMLNTMIQAQFHPGAAELEQGSKLWKVGDKVMQLRNNYELEVFNGDIGRLVQIDPVDEQITVDFDGRRVRYPFNGLDELTLAWAITVHKSQGSEYPVVILPMLTQHYMMLQRNLLYTALTRAKKLAILVGSQKAVSIAVQNARADTRYTRLAERVRQFAAD